MSNKRTADGHAATGFLVLGAEWYALEQLLLSLLTFFGLELLHRYSERGAIFGSDGLTFDERDVRRVGVVAPRAGQLVGLQASSLDVLAVPFASVTMAGGLVVCACLERTDPCLDGGIVLGRLGRRQEVEDVMVVQHPGQRLPGIVGVFVCDGKAAGVELAV